MTTGVKAASFAAFMRVFLQMGYGQEAIGKLHVHLHDLIWILAVATMVVGNVVALTQTNLKRMLAYSSIAHTGYLLVGVLTGSKSEFGYSSVGFYLMTYSIMSIGAFAILTLVSNRGDTELNLHDLSGLSRKHPWLSFALAVFVFSMAGIPPTAGFIAKYNLLYGAVQAGETPLVIVAVLCSAVSIYYYLRVLVYLYMRDPTPRDERILRQSGYWITIAITTMVTLTLHAGLIPTKLESVAKAAFQQFPNK
jgi:NADH-quinone oxidoreductase subunit N